MKKENVILIKSKGLALRIIRLYRYLSGEKKEFVLSKQIMRSGTSIGANCKEAVVAQSKADFNSKLSIALKEANETEYWLELLHESGYIDDSSFQSVYDENKEIIKLLVSILKSSRRATSDQETQHCQSQLCLFNCKL